MNRCDGTNERHEIGLGNVARDRDVVAPAGGDGEGDDPAAHGRALEDRVFDWILERRLELPVSLLLEMHLPLTSVLHTSTLLLQPALAPFFGLERIESFGALLADRERVARLAERLRESTEPGLRK